MEKIAHLNNEKRGGGVIRAVHLKLYFKVEKYNMPAF